MRRTIQVLSIVMVIAILTMLYIYNPSETSWAPKCVFKAVTGLSCSGCGMQRFLHAMMHGRFLEAIQYNYLLVILIPYLALFGIEKLFLTGETQKRWKRVIEGRAAVIILCIIAPSWLVIRNILHI